MTRRCSHRVVREVHIDVDVESATDEELGAAILLVDVGMGISLAAAKICNQQRSETSCR